MERVDIRLLYHSLVSDLFHPRNLSGKTGSVTMFREDALQGADGANGRISQASRLKLRGFRMV